MSFKRKTVSLTSNPSRTPPQALGASTAVPRGPMGANSGAAIPPRGRPTPTMATAANAAISAPKSILEHCGVRPSTQLSVPTVSTGSSSLDDVVGHMGLPLGSMLLLEESGNTDFASVILRSFAAQSILQSRVTDSGAMKESKVIVVGVDESWGSEIPGVYMDKKEKKKMDIAQDNAKVSVGNLAHDSAERKSMKIAWRYANNNGSAAPKEAADLSSKPFYSTPLDFKTRIRPLPSPQELEVLKPIPHASKTFLGSLLERLAHSIEAALKKSPSTVIRVVVPSLLHPAIYPPDCSTSSEVVRFMHGLVCLARKHTGNVAIIASISLELYPRHSSLVKWVETLMDGLLHIDPFPEKMDSLVAEAPSDSSANKAYQGLLNVYKLPVLSERGQMVTRRGELAFRVGRKSFEVEEWGIPVEEEAAAPEPSQQQQQQPGEVDINKAAPVDLKKLDF